MDNSIVLQAAATWQWALSWCASFRLRWETRQPRRTPGWPAGRRWGLHAILFAIAVIGVPLLLRGTPVAAAAALEGAGSRGLVAPIRALPAAAALIVTFLLFDLTQYAAHRILHIVPALWRIHEIHHSDPDFDVATAARFHPLEVLATTASQLAAVALFAPPVWAVLVCQLVAMSVNFVSHGNVALPRRVERVLRGALITPDLHRVHHSADPRDYSRNFGQSLAIWDRAFGTILENPAAGVDHMKTGVPGVGGEESLRLGYLLMRPFLTTGRAGEQPAERTQSAGQQG